MAFLIVSWFAQRDFHIGYVVSPVAFLIATWSCNRYSKVALEVVLPVQTHCQRLHGIVGSDRGPGAPHERLFAGVSLGALHRTGALQGQNQERCCLGALLEGCSVQERCRGRNDQMVTKEVNLAESYLN